MYKMTVHSIGDFMIGTGEVRISYENDDPEVVAVHFHVDGVAQEGNESFTMKLVPSHSLVLPSGESVFFCSTIDVTIIDSDGKLAYIEIAISTLSL